MLVIAAVATIAGLRDIPHHAELAVGAFALLTLAAMLASNLLWNRDDAAALAIVLGVALLARLLLLFKTPFLSTDAYRYLWDGRLLLHGIDPYVVAPADAGLQLLRSPWLYQHLDWRTTPSLYPPLALALFATGALLSRDSLLAIKLLMALGDVVALALLVQLLRDFHLPRGRAVMYAWSPLVIVEFAWSGHLESWCLAALALALLMQRRGKLFACAAALAAAVLVKLYPLIAVPVFFPRRPWTPIAWVIAIVGAVYLPFVVWHGNVVGFLPQFVTHYHFNNSLFGIVPGPLIVALLVVGAAAVIVARRAGLGMPEALIVLIAAYFALSPTVNPWYLTVFALLLPLVANPFEGALAPLFQGIQLWLLLALLGYAAEAAPAARAVEYAPLYVGAAWSALRVLAARASANGGAWLRGV